VSEYVIAILERAVPAQAEADFSPRRLTKEVVDYFRQAREATMQVESSQLTRPIWFGRKFSPSRRLFWHTNWPALWTSGYVVASSVSNLPRRGSPVRSDGAIRRALSRACRARAM